MPTRSARRPGALRDGSREERAPARILVVEDESLSRQTLIDLLETHGYRVLAATCGDEVFDQLGEADLVLLDAMLPGRDGWDICEEIKSEIDPLLPIIMVTARTAPDDVARTFEAGADDYVPKPYQAVELTARIESRLRAHRIERALQRANQQASELANQNYRLYQQARRDAEERANLLRELDHRVRNNLSVILGLVSMERSREPARSAAAALAALENRLRTFLVVYEALRRKNYHGVPLREIAERLAQKLRNSADPHGRIHLEIVGDDVTLTERQGFAVSLALNEVVTNALQHAFPDGRDGELSITLGRSDGVLCLEVADDGVGMERDESAGAAGTAKFGGRAFVHALVCTELGGEVDCASTDEGTRVTLRVPLEPLEEPPASDG